jgi:hypothetical protein
MKWAMTFLAKSQVHEGIHSQESATAAQLHLLPDQIIKRVMKLLLHLSYLIEEHDMIFTAETYIPTA